MRNSLFLPCSWLRKAFLVAAVLAQTTVVHAQGSHIIKFAAWGRLLEQTESDRQMFLLGFLNGVFAGATDRPESNDTRVGRFLLCVVASQKISLRQAVRMVDDYFRTHPKDANLTIGEGITKALTLKGSLCEDKAWFEEAH